MNRRRRTIRNDFLAVTIPLFPESTLDSMNYSLPENYNSCKYSIYKRQNGSKEKSSGIGVYIGIGVTRKKRKENTN